MLCQVQHTCRIIYTRQFISFTRQGYQQSPTATCQFQQRTTAQLCKVCIQVQIFVKVCMLYIIERCNQVVVIHLLDVIKPGNFPGAIYLLQLELNIIGWSTSTSDRNGYTRCIVIY